MELKELLGADWKDGMSIEDINAALANRRFVDPTSLPASVAKETFDKTASELAAAKRELETLKNAGLTAEERAKRAEEDAAAARRQYALKSNRLDVEKILVANGLTEADYAGFIDSIVGEDPAVCVAVASSIAKAIADQRKAADAAARKDKLQNAPKPTDGKGEPSMTLEKLYKLTAEERAEFYQKNPEQYRALHENSGGNH